VLYELLHTTEIDNRILAFRKLANDLKRELTKLQTLKLRLRRVVAKGAFDPSFAELDDTNQPQSKGDIEDEKGRKKSKQKLTTKGLLIKCSTCKI
jgi:hypothetical protein